MFDEIKITQKTVFETLTNSFKNDRLSHAYLFSSGVGIQKLEMALLFSMMFYCEKNQMCGQCSQCKRIIELKHPNIIYIKPDGLSIKKEQILGLQNEFSKTSLENGPRIYIIDNAEKMTSSSGNSLLKFIEDPNSNNTYGILLTENVSFILPTILSRCQIINFRTPDKAILANKLSELNYSKEEIFILSRITNSLDEAIIYHDNPIFNSLLNITHKLLEIMHKKSEDSILYLKDYYSLIEDRENFLLFLNMLFVMIEDELKKNINKDKNLTRLNDIMEMKKRINFYVNHILMFELFLLKEQEDKR